MTGSTTTVCPHCSNDGTGSEAHKRTTDILQKERDEAREALFRFARLDSDQIDKIMRHPEIIKGLLAESVETVADLIIEVMVGP